MAEQLEILDVRIGAPRAAKFTATQQRLDVAIEVRNNSKSTLHVISSVRSLDFDPATQTLSVGLSEPEPQREIKPLQFLEPHTVTVAPRQTATLEVSVPLVIRKVVPSSKMGLGLENLDVSGVQNVKCQIAFSSKPFYPKSADSAEHMFRELRAWGTKTEKTLPRTVSSDATNHNAEHHAKRRRKPGQKES